MNKSQTVFVGLSGGVDSSVAALRLIKQGYSVVGVFIKVWHPDFMICNWEAERLDAMRVAAHLDIPFLTCDAEEQYRDDVAEYFIEEYRAGRTPNPDVMCNQYVKFGAFMQFAKDKGADFIATGHYAQRIEAELGAEMHRGVDTNKDQTYFLWTLSKEQLEYSLFPVGDTPKDEIRKEAEAAGIPTAQKKDSQGVCFLGQVDIPEFLSHYIDLVPGAVLNTKGEIVGQHKGAQVYTAGQRHGFTLSTTDTKRPAMFIIKTDLNKNTITVDTNKPEVTNQSDLVLDKVILRRQVSVGDKLEVQVRHRQTPFAATVSKLEGTTMLLTPDQTEELTAVGQSCVLYVGEECLGGGILS
ncbi:MAG: tRNA 2-thiouridine(34) synthase MnmA [Candidatus Pacebacteria bacterium]|nr:tRNA 2-thiouridine(34) synthase MnmA [Candidatus Paceibacterota bacterium]